MIPEGAFNTESLQGGPAFFYSTPPWQLIMATRFGAHNRNKYHTHQYIAHYILQFFDTEVQHESKLGEQWD